MAGVASGKERASMFFQNICAAASMTSAVALALSESSDLQQQACSCSAVVALQMAMQSGNELCRHEQAVQQEETGPPHQQIACRCSCPVDIHKRCSEHRQHPCSSTSGNEADAQ